MPQFGALAAGEMFNHPCAVLPLPDETLLVADSWNNMVVKIELDGTVSHFAGIPTEAWYQEMGTFSGDGGPATQAGMNTPDGLALGPDGEIYIADLFNHRIRWVDGSGTIRTLWGSVAGYSADGMTLNLPTAPVVWGRELYVVDSGNGMVSRFRLDLIPK